MKTSILGKWGMQWSLKLQKDLEKIEDDLFKQIMSETENKNVSKANTDVALP